LSASVQSLPVNNKSRPVSAQSRPVSAQSRPVSDQSHPVSAQSRPVSAQSRPVSAQSRPVSTQSRPVSAQSRPVSAQSRPVSNRDDRSVNKSTAELMSADANDADSAGGVPNLQGCMQPRLPLSRRGSNLDGWTTDIVEDPMAHRPPVSPRAQLLQV
jgi:hypothetical protein